MSTALTGAEARVRRVGLRTRLALGFGAAAGLLCVALSFTAGELARAQIEAQAGPYLARIALEYRERLGELPVKRGAQHKFIDLAAARELRTAIEASVDPAMPVELMLIASDGTVISGPPALDGLRVASTLDSGGASGALLQRWPDGERYLVASAGVDPATRWAPLARTRADAVFAPAALLQRTILWAGLVLALAGLAAGWALATRHARPLEALTRAAQEMAWGNDRTELPPLDDNREVAHLAQALRAMLGRLREQAESLRDARERLQRRVHERTAELVKSQAELQLQVAEAGMARADLARAQAQLALALEAADLALFELDVSEQRMHPGAGWSSIEELVPAEQRRGMMQALQAAASGCAQEVRLEHPVVCSDGSVIRVAARGTVTERNADGTPRRLVGTYRKLA